MRKLCCSKYVFVFLKIFLILNFCLANVFDVVDDNILLWKIKKWTFRAGRRRHLVDF